MMKPVLVGLLILTAHSVTAGDRSSRKHKNDKENPHSLFDVRALNSPVKESVAKFLIKTPDRFDIDEISYQVKNAGRIFEKPRDYQKINLVNGSQGKELRVNVSKLPPGFYQLLVKIKDKSKKEHHFKTQFKDHATFVIDSSLQVPMPDPVKNNATLLGIDSDNDGIRDDVQRWINENFSNKPEELKLAYKQYAVAIQASLPTSNDKQLSIQASHLTLKAQGCLFRIGDEAGVPASEQIKLRQMVKMMYLNTRNRIESELKADQHFHGQEVRTHLKEETCNF